MSQGSDDFLFYSYIRFHINWEKKTNLFIDTLSSYLYLVVPVLSESMFVLK